MPTPRVGTHAETLCVSSGKWGRLIPGIPDGTQSVPTGVPTQSVGTRELNTSYPPRDDRMKGSNSPAPKEDNPCVTQS